MAIGIFHLCVPCSKLFGGDCLRTHKSSGSKVYQGHDTSENCNPVVQNDLTLSYLGLLSIYCLRSTSAYLPVQVWHVEHDGGAFILSLLVGRDLTPTLNDLIYLGLRGSEVDKLSKNQPGIFPRSFSRKWCYKLCFLLVDTYSIIR